MKHLWRVFAAVLLVIGMSYVVDVRDAVAYDAILAWKPVKSAVGYRVYVADRPDLANARKVEVKSPDVARDGVIRFRIDDVALQPTTYFAVAAYDAAGRESRPSNVRPLAAGTVLAVQEAGRNDAEASGR